MNLLRLAASAVGILAAVGTAQAQTFTFNPPSVTAGSPDFVLKILTTVTSSFGEFDAEESFSWQGPTNPAPATPSPLCRSTSA